MGWSSAKRGVKVSPSSCSSPQHRCVMPPTIRSFSVLLMVDDDQSQQARVATGFLTTMGNVIKHASLNVVGCGSSSDLLQQQIISWGIRIWRTWVRDERLDIGVLDTIYV